MYTDPDEVRSWLGVTDSKLDGLIEIAIPAAEGWINAYCDRTFDLASSASARYYDVDPRTGVVLVDEIGDASTVAVAVDDAFNGTWSTAWSASDYQLGPLNPGFEVRPYTNITTTGARYFPRQFTYRQGLIRVTARWGWPAVPDKVRLAAIMQAARLVNRRSSPNGVAGFNDLGVVRVSSTDRDIEALLADFHSPGIG